MRMSPSPSQTQLIVDRMWQQMQGDREPGVHISSLVHCLRKAWLEQHQDSPSNGLTKPLLEERQEGLPGNQQVPSPQDSEQTSFNEQPSQSSLMTLPSISPSTILLFATGRAIQDYVTASPADVSEVKLLVDGVHGTADHVHEGVPWEIKATYASAAREVVDTPHYFDQLAAYASMLKANSGLLVVFYINGYYDFMRKGPRKDAVANERSVLKAWDIQYEPGELDAHWARLMKRKDILTSAQQLSDIPLTMHYTWECKFCPFFEQQCPGGKGLYQNHWE